MMIHYATDGKAWTREWSVARRTRAGDGKRERILEGAIEAFAAKGFHGTRVRDVAVAAGVADGTIYLYFASKNDLLESIFRSAMERFHRNGEAHVLAVEGAVEQMNRLVEVQLELLGENRRLTTVFQIDLRHSQHFLGEISRSVLRPHLEFIAGIIARGVAQGVFVDGASPLLRASMVFGVLDQLATNWVLSSRNYRLESQVDEAQRFVLQALGARRPG